MDTVHAWTPSTHGQWRVQSSWFSYSSDKARKREREREGKKKKKEEEKRKARQGDGTHRSLVVEAVIRRLSILVEIGIDLR